MIENLLIQQVLLYTRERAKQTRRVRTPKQAPNSILVRQQVRPSTDFKGSNVDDDEPTLCLIESDETATANNNNNNNNNNKSSNLIENIIDEYNQPNDQSSRFDQNLMELLVERNRQRRSVAYGPNTIFYARLQWLAIGLVIDRFFFCIYFLATIISYFVTLWLIPFSHPNLTIDVEKL